MALAETTLSSAVAALDKVINVASATSFAAGRFIRVDNEVMKVTQDYVSGTAIPVLRGLQGSQSVAHPISARVVHGNGDDFPVAPGQAVPYPFVPTRSRVSYSATGTLTLPVPGQDIDVVLNGTAITLTIPVPTKELDGCRLRFINSSAAAHVLTFTGGLSAAGSSYDVITLNATGQVAVEVQAENEVWVALAAIPVAGTVTNVTGTLS